MTHHALLGRMKTSVDTWETNGDRRAIFLACYALMTHNMLDGINAGRFDDNDWVYRLVHNFAEYYFIALEAYERNTGWLPDVWRQAHDLTRAPEMPPLVHLLLGVNAHINCDLVLVLDDMLRDEWDDLTLQMSQPRLDDYLLVNTIIGETIDSVQDHVLKRYSPAMGVVDVAFGRLDEWCTARLIRNWRHDVWKQAVTLIQAKDAQTRMTLRRQVDVLALRRMNLVVAGGAFGVRVFGYSQRWLRRLGVTPDQ